MYIGWIYQYQFMVTFLPTFVKRVLPGVPFVTRFENVMGADPGRTSLVARTVRKLLATADRRGNVNYGFGTLLRDSDRLIILSEAHRAVVSACLPGAERWTTLIPPPANMRLSSEANGAARKAGREKLGVADDAFVVAYIGYLHQGKGLETLLAAFQQVARRRDRARLVMIGGPIAPESGNPERYATGLAELARQLGIADRVHWTGEYTWDREEASLYLRAADVCVLPFRRGVHLNNSSLASAAVHGMPFVGTRGDLLETAFVHGGNVFLCPPDAPDALAAGIEAVMEDAGLRQRLGAGSRELAREWFSWDSALERTLGALTATRSPSPS
jgi:glycosyltransferase involved in cell wall biosynthesis